MGGRHTVAKRCSECNERLVYPEDHAKAGENKPLGTITCGTKCRQKRATRRNRAAKLSGQKSKHPPEVQDMAAATRGATSDMVHEVLKEELRPLIREAMTEDVLKSISTLVKLTPAAITALSGDLSCEDETIRQRAYTLLLKYTMGNPSVAPPPTQQAPAPMSVIFNVPRPGDPTDTTPAVEQLEGPVELRECTDCHEHKAPQDFVGASPRCQECFDALHATLADRFAVEDDSAPE